MLGSTRTVSLHLLAIVTLGFAGCQGKQCTVGCDAGADQVQRSRAVQVVKMLDDQFGAGEAMTPASIEMYCSYLHRAYGGHGATEESVIAYQKRLDALRDQVIQTYDGNKQLAYIIDYYANLKSCAGCGRTTGNRCSE